MIVKVPDVAWFQFPFVKFIRAKIPTNMVIGRSTGNPPSSLFFFLRLSFFVDTAQKQSDRELFVCPWNASVIVKAYHNLGAWNARQREKRGSQTGQKKGFNKTLSGVTWALPSSSAPPPPATPWHCASNIQRALRAQRRESRLTLPISYCLSVSLILSGGGQLPFWTAVSRHILAVRLAANKSQPGIYFSFPFYL